MWHRRYIVTFALAGALAAGCEARAPADAQARDLVRPRLGFAVNVPPGWNFKDLSGDVVLEMYPPAAPATPAGAPAHPAPAPASGAAPSSAAAHPPAQAEPAAPPAARPARPLRAAVHVAAIDREGIALDAWADQAVHESKEFEPDLEVVSRQAARLADGRDALALVLRSPRGLAPSVQRMLLALTDGRAYALVATAPEPDWPAIDAAVRQCFDSFIVW